MSIGSMSNVLSTLSSAFKLPNQPVTPLPPPLVMSGANMRTGLSAKDMASKIISRQSEAGAPVGDIYNSTESITEAMERIRAEEIVNALLTKSKVEIVVPAGIPVTATGANAAGPVVSQGATTNLAQGQGVLR